MRHISEAIRDLDDAALRAASADRENAWLKVLEAAGEYEAALGYENDVREDVHRRRFERIKFLHDLNEHAAEKSS